MSKISNYKIGSDIEWFLQDKETKEIVSAEGIIKGTKYDPHHFDPNDHFFATSLDNVMAEGNIPPATTPAEFFNNVQKLIDYINSSIPSNLQTIALPSARLDLKYLQTDNSRIFGCDPSMNCWTREMIHPQPLEETLRSTGFHVHVGYDNPNEETNIAIAKAMDLFLGVGSILIEPSNERKLVGYGCAGNFRHQGHGMEYRSLSGYFSSNQSLIEWCFNNTQKAIDFVNNERISEIESLSDRIQNVINYENKEEAKEIIEQFQIELV